MRNDEVNLFMNGLRYRLKFQEKPRAPHVPNAWLLISGAALLFLGLMVKAAWAESYSDDQIATAIYYAEGGAHTSHPYGILAHYKHTTPRQACLNTIAHARRDWNGKGDFITFLGSRYCPVGAANDPRGLNKNWVRNVTKILKERR